MDELIGVEKATLPLEVPPTRQPSLPVSPGRPAFDEVALTSFQALPPDKQREELKSEWVDAAYILSQRLKRFARTVTTKDYGRLQQLVTSAGIAFDKVFPKGENNGVAIHGSVMFNLFGNLGVDKITKILTPQVAPKLKEIPDERANREP